MCDDADIRAKRGEFIGSVNRLNVQFRVVPDQIRIRLLQTYCTQCLRLASTRRPEADSFANGPTSLASCWPGGSTT